MTSIGLAQIAIVLIAVIVAAVPLGGYIAKVLAGERTLITAALAPVERAFYSLAGVDPTGAKLAGVRDGGARLQRCRICFALCFVTCP
jgi:K+-transporting ATPase A subunit